MVGMEKKGEKGSGLALKIILIGLFVILMWPRSLFSAPEIGTDASWRLSIDLAVKNGFTFGTDYIFTYGPLGYLSTRSPLGLDKPGMLLFDLFMLSCMAFMLNYALSKHNWGPWAVLACFALGIALLASGNVYQSDVVFIVMAIFLFFAYYSIFEMEPLALAISLAAAILLFFMKVNLGLFTIILFALFLAVLAWKDVMRKQALAALAAIPILILPLSVILKVDMPTYLVASFHIMNSYNDAMAIDPFTQKFSYILLGAAALVLLSFAAIVIKKLVELAKDGGLKKKGAATAIAGKALLPIFAAVFLFLAFKQSFVRADITHVLTFIKFSPFVIGIAYLFADGSAKKHLKILFVATLLLDIAVVLGTSITAPPELGTKDALAYKMGGLAKTYFDPATYFGLLGDKISSLETYFGQLLSPAYAPDISALAAQAKFPDRVLARIGQSSADIMPTEISYIYLNNLTYDPRPVIQSYSVFDEYLDNRNYQKYMSASAPEYLLYSEWSIDNRYPFFDDTQTKLAILKNYRIVDRFGDIILFERAENNVGLSVAKTTATTGKFGEEIALENTACLQYAKINVKYSLFGELERLLFQPPEITMAMKLYDGRTVQYKAVKTLLNDGVILNKYVDSTDDAETYYSTKGAGSINVRSVKFTTADNLAYESTFGITMDCLNAN